MRKLLGYDWSYINEGNAHIVLQLKDSEFVLRLIKEDAKAVDIMSAQTAINFVNFIMTPLLFDGINYGMQKLMILPPEELTSLGPALHEMRLKNRRTKSLISRYAIQTYNLTLLNPKCNLNYCIEIKPKEGFLSSRLKPLGKCYYCLKQYLKLEAGDIQAKSFYCPLDLFSGNQDRMRQALVNLFDKPQNNIKLFKNGQVIYDDESTSIELEAIIKEMNLFNSTTQFLDFIIRILLNDMDPKESVEDNQKIYSLLDGHPTKYPNKCVEEFSLNKYTSSLLLKLLQTQKLSDCGSLDENTIKRNSDGYIETLVSQICNMKPELTDNLLRDKFFKSLHPVHAAFIAAVARDSSIMISFSPNFVEELPFIKIGSNRIPYRLAVTDLEPKKVNTLLKRIKTENKLIDIYKNKVDKESCKIQPNTETKAKQLEAWEHLITVYMKANKLSTLDIRESLNSPLFNNTSINRKLSQEAVLTILEDMGRSGRAAAVDKSRNVWEVYWHSLDEWGNMVYNWASSNGMTNSVCTLFELREGENTAEEEFHGLDMNVLVKALKSLEARGKCELMEFDESQGVKFF